MISIVIPCYNEQDVLPELFSRLKLSAETWSESFEVIVVDDGSNDNTCRILSDIHKKDARWKIVKLARNFGHQKAVSAGLYYATGDCVIIMDADLQDPPEELHKFISKWRDGYEVVYAIRAKRNEGVIKRICYKAFYRILSRLSNIEIPHDAGDFCLMDKRVVEIINSMPERNRFLRGLRSWVGFRQTGIKYDRPARAAGSIKYSFRDLFHLAFDGIFAFSTIPLKLSTFLGFGVSIMTIIGIVFCFLQRIFSGWFMTIGLGPVPGFATIVISILFLGGVQLICLGIIGEYLGRIYEEVKQRPLWTVSELTGIED